MKTCQKMQKVQLDAKEFYNLIQSYKLALFSSSPTDDYVYFIYVEPAKIQLEFCGKELCYILRAEVDDGTTFGGFGGLMLKGAVFDCRICSNRESESLSVAFRSDMMDRESYLILKNFF